MDKEKLTAGGIGYERGLARFMKNEKMYEEFLRGFLSDTCMERSRDAFEKKDYEALLSSTHELKGVSGNLELADVYKYSSEVVALIRAGDYASIPDSFAGFEKAYRQIVSVIESA